MKTKLVTLLFVGLSAGCLVGLAQNPADEKVQKLYNQPATSAGKAAAPAEAPTAAPAEAIGEILPLVQPQIQRNRWTFAMGLSKAYEYGVLEYPYAFHQPSELLRYFAVRPEVAIRRYKRFVHDGLARAGAVPWSDQETWSPPHGSIAT